MKTLVLGATGPTGQHLVRDLLSAGHTVTAMVRRPEAVTDRPVGLSVLRGDATRAEDLQIALADQDAVLSTLGMGSSVKATGMFTQAATALTDTAKKSSVSRVVWLSSFGAGNSFAHASRTQKVIYRTLLRSIYADKAVGDDIVRTGGLRWTVVLPTRLTNASAQGRYQAAQRLPMKGNPTIARADVAAFMSATLTDEQWVNRDVVISD